MDNITLYEAMNYIDNCITVTESKTKENKFNTYDDHDLKMIQRSNKRELKSDIGSLAIDAIGAGVSTAAVIKLKKSFDKVNSELKDEKAKDNPDENKIKELKKKLTGIKIKMTALVGVGAVSANDAIDASKYVYKNYDNYKSATNVLNKRNKDK